MSLRSYRLRWMALPMAPLVMLVVASCAGGAGASGGASTLPNVPRYDVRLDTAWSPPAALTAHYQNIRTVGTAAHRTLVPDATLAACAQAAADRVAADPEHRAPATQALQTMAWSAGVIDPLPAIIVARGSAGTGPDIANAMVAAELRDTPYDRLGIGRATTAQGEQVLVVALTQRRLALNLAIARQMHVGQRLIVNARLVEGLRNPELAVTRPDGRTERFPLGEGPTFMGQMPLVARGTYQIEVLAESDGGATVIANFPVYVDTSPPTTVDTASRATNEQPAQVEQALLAFVNEVRRGAGRRPLELMPALSQVARGHSEDMATNHFIAHNSRTNGTPSDRLRRGNLTSGVILENVARGYNSREIHDGLMSSPGHRANILNENVTHVGVGVARETGSGGAFLATENFIEVGAVIDPAQVANQLLETINRDRQARGAATVQMRPQLSDVASASARSFFQDTPRPTQQSVVDRTNQQVSRFGLLFRRVSVLATVVPRAIDAGGLDPLRDPAIASIGIGVAQGSRPDTPPNAVFVVYVLGFPR